MCPRNVQVTSTTPSSISVTWQAPESDGGSPITDYILEMRSNIQLEYATLAKVNGSEHKYEALGLPKNKKFYICVKAKNRAGVSEASAEWDRPAITKYPEGDHYMHALQLYNISCLNSESTYMYMFILGTSVWLYFHIN